MEWNGMVWVDFLRLLFFAPRFFREFFFFLRVFFFVLFFRVSFLPFFLLFFLLFAFAFLFWAKCGGGGGDIIITRGRLTFE